MYKKRIAELKAEIKKMKAEIKTKLKGVTVLGKDIEQYAVEVSYLKALHSYSTGKKPLPSLGLPTVGKKRGPKPGKKRGRRAGKGLSILIPEILKESKDGLSMKELIEEAGKHGWKSSSAKPYQVAFVAAQNLVKKGVIKKIEGKYKA